MQLAKLAIKQHSILQDINQKKRSISKLKQQLQPLNQEFKKYQAQLNQYLQLHYQLGQAQPIALILNQRDPAITSRLLSYITYINKSRAKLLKQLASLSKTIKQKQTIEKQQLQELQYLKQRQQHAHEQYQQDKVLQQEIIATLAKQIHSRSYKIKQLKLNKQRLEKVIMTLALEKKRQASKTPFKTLRHKLPWPTKGIVDRKSPKALQLNGIYIQAKEGRQVNAVHTGKVVFADWLKGYGLLLIIQHDSGFMTLYANNQTLYKTKGKTVYSGEKIASIGHSGGQLADGLYFEIRRNGQPLQPLQWLKSRKRR